MTQETDIQFTPNVDPIALFDGIAATEVARVEAEEARIAFENQACRELRDALLEALVVLFRARELHLRWFHSGDPPRLSVYRASLFIDDTRRGDDLALRVAGGYNGAEPVRGGAEVALRAEFDKASGKPYLVHVYGGVRRDRFENWISAYEFVVRRIASDMAENARDQKRRRPS